MDISMSNNSRLNNFGDQIKGALNDALTTGNYNELKSLVSDTVTSALNEAGATASKAWQQKEEWKRQQQVEQAQRQRDARERVVREHAARAAQAQQMREAQFKAQQARVAQVRAQREAQLQQRNALMEQQRLQRTGLVVNVKNNGYVAGVLFIVFGAIANIPLFVLSIIGLACSWGLVSTGFLLFFLVMSILFICLGKKKLQLIGKAKRYVRLCGPKMYAQIEDLAAQVGLSTKKVEKEIRRILQKGIIPSARMDNKGTHLMLTDEIYKQYTDAEKARVLREKEEKEQAKSQRKMAKESVTEESPKTELEQMMEEGQECIQKLRYMNDLIPGEAISSKLYQLEDLLKEIFQRVQNEPAQMNRMHKVMNYYLPTTLKLVEAYHEFDIMSSPNEEIVSAKKEIEETLDTINEAFVELLNSLFQDKVFDITTDAQVLQTMLANEGLTKEMDVTKSNT